MDEIDISKGQSLGTFLVLFFLLDNGFFCKKKREGKSGSKSCESKRGFSQWTKKSHTQKEQRCSICQGPRRHFEFGGAEKISGAATYINFDFFFFLYNYYYYHIYISYKGAPKMGSQPA